MYVFTLDSAAFLFVPPAPSSTTIKSASANAAPMSVPPSISKLAIAKAPALAPTYVAILEAAIFLLVPPAPSSTMNKSASAKFAPISVPPSISSVAKPTVLFEFVIVLFVKLCVAAIPAIVSVTAGSVNVVLPEKSECAGACICA